MVLKIVTAIILFALAMILMYRMDRNSQGSKKKRLVLGKNNRL